MDQQQTLVKLKELVDKSKEIIIVTHTAPTIDSIGAALSMYLGFSGLGKKVHIICPDPMTVAFSNYVGVNKIEQQISGKKNFIISLDYQEGSIEKVSYNIEGNKFNLVIEPRKGFEDFSSEKVQYHTAGVQADLLIVLDTQHLGQLGTLHEEQKELFASIPMVNIDAHAGNASFGAINLLDEKASSTTELAAVVLSFCGVKLTEDIATNLLNAIDATTDHFQSPTVNARTFEIASVSVKAGGKKFPPVGIQEATVVEPKDQPVPPTVIAEQPASDQPEDVLKPKIFKPQLN